MLSGKLADILSIGDIKAYHISHAIQAIKSDSTGTLQSDAVNGIVEILTTMDTYINADTVPPAIVKKHQNSIAAQVLDLHERLECVEDEIGNITN